ncbi:MAG: endolytic transglycosylase MltG [Solirubrobacterales bacterium]
MSTGRSEEEREAARIQRERKRSTQRGETPPPPPQWKETRAEPRFEPPPPPSQREPTAPKPPRGPGPVNRRRNVVLAVAGVVALLFVLFLNSVFQPFAGDGKGSGKVPVAVPKGADVGQIGELLAAKDVVPSARKFGWRAGWSGKSDDFKAGRYVFGEGMSYSAAIDLLAKGPNAGTTVLTIPEGRSRYEIDLLASSAGLTGDYMAATKSSPLLSPQRYGAPKSVDSLEGFLFPATYEVAAGANVNKLVPQQLTAFKNNIGEVNMRFARSKNLTVYDIVTIASLIEREVSEPSERKLVSAVIYNRLKAGIPLGIDATTRFETHNWTDPLTNAQLQSNTPYNTRLRKGLPPGPIGNPGIASLKAAAHPASVGYLFYVANPCRPGTHSFSKTDAEFQQDVARYNDARAKAGGKQPTGC